MNGHPWQDDDRLFASLKEALREAEDVPPRFLETARAAFAWHNIDAELAALTYDSAEVFPAPAGSVRAQDASLRALTYATHDLTIEVEITPDALLGQVLPAQPGSVTVHPLRGSIAEARIDEMGFFALRPVPTSSFRLRCTTTGATVVTGWIAP
jgi:hypothetical protein